MQKAVLKDLTSWQRIALVMLLGHLVLCAVTSQFSLGIAALDGALVTMILAHRRTRDFAISILPFWIVMVSYISIMPLVMPYRGEVHVADLYDAEVRYFGYEGEDGQRHMLPDLFTDLHWPAVDLICGLVYMCVLPQLLPFFSYLYLFDRARLPLLMWTHCSVHLLGYAGYVLYPAAPPWYVQEYGLGPAILDTPSSAAGLLRVDELLGLPLVESYYAQSSNVFGAMPSLHVGSALLFVFIAWGMGLRWFVPTFLFFCLMSFGSVYFRHHYVLDGIVGGILAMIGFAVVYSIYNWNIRRSGSLASPQDKWAADSESEDSTVIQAA